LYAQLKVFPKDENPLRSSRRNLLELLEVRLDRNIERIFRLLDLRYSSNDFLTIYINLREGQPEQRNSALEFLENLLEPSLAELILPVAEIAIMEVSISENSVLTLPKNLPEEAVCYQEIFDLNDHQLTLSLLHLIRTAEASHYVDMLLPLRDSPHSFIRTIVEETLEAIAPKH
jgi:AAA family ATP:ADP antiporter